MVTASSSEGYSRQDYDLPMTSSNVAFRCGSPSRSGNVRTDGHGHVFEGEVQHDPPTAALSDNAGLPIFLPREVREISNDDEDYNDEHELRNRTNNLIERYNRMMSNLCRSTLSTNTDDVARSRGHGRNRRRKIRRKPRRADEASPSWTSQASNVNEQDSSSGARPSRKRSRPTKPRPGRAKRAASACETARPGRGVGGLTPLVSNVICNRHITLPIRARPLFATTILSPRKGGDREMGQSRRNCPICSKAYGGAVLPALLVCCGGHLCVDCAEGHRESLLHRCAFCETIFQINTPWAINRPFIEEAGITDEPSRTLTLLAWLVQGEA
ncbi:hypothetical protein THAOC_14908 [Thalassiosira oceanica]|uniref:Uncharacterized protein n=1 Tax=Thalassiosira oceanica TaxID=159749 RepID=K0SHA5_THAOC|nr:hypothetical protein THAOC_14908 [Thalassiosira oceanica]|eukprot:EJK64369.1 hypothetical protein THAOC_14908 [Thalassiosira oceanica]